MTFLYNGRLNDLDLEIAKFIEHNPCFVSNSDIFTIALKIGVSASKITKYCQKIGLKGFKELRYKLAEQVKVTNFINENFGDKFSVLDCIENKAIDNLKYGLKTLKEAKKVAIIASGEQMGLAIYLCDKLRLTYGFDAYYYEQHLNLEQLSLSDNFVFIVIDKCSYFFDQTPAMKMRLIGCDIIHVSTTEISSGSNYIPILVNQKKMTFSYEIKLFIILTWLVTY